MAGEANSASSASSHEPDAAEIREENRALENALQLSKKRLSAMRDVARALAGHLDLDDLLQQIIAKASELVEADRASLFLVDREQEELWSRVAEGLGDPAEGNVAIIRLPMGRGIAGFVAQTGVALNLPDAYEDPRFNRDVDAKTGYRTRSMLCTPVLNADGRAIGVIQALNKRGDSSFTVEDERLLEAIGHQVSVALQNSLLFEEIRRKATSLEATRGELQRRISELNLLRDIDGTMRDAGGPEELLDAVARRIAQIVDADASSIATIDLSSGGIAFRAATGAAAEEVKTKMLPPERGIIGAAIEKGELIKVENASDDPRHDKRLADALGFTPGPLLASPLMADGRALGAIEVMRARDGAGFSDDDERILGLLSARVALALNSARRRERSKRDDQLQTIGTMLSGIVHDFKTPMTVISGYVQLMADADEAKERQECADIVLKQTDMMTAMTRELLQFARGETEILIRKVYMQNFVRDLQDMLGQLFKSSDVEFSSEIKYRGAARFDEVKLKRAIANIAKNAKEALQGKGQFKLTVQQVGDQVEFALADDGPGLPVEIESRLFESFATHGKEDGTGLGLALVKKIIDDHQGEIRVENKPGHGVTFRLRLPV
jgi:signal transduction histidine kinase